MNSIEANTRNTKTKGELNLLRINGNVPAIIYGGEAQNQTVSISKKPNDPSFLVNDNLHLVAEISKTKLTS